MFLIKNTKNRGFTLVEILISIGISSLILIALVAFQSSIFTSNRILQFGLLNQQEAKKIIRPFANEVRGATKSALGGYPIDAAGDSIFSFYTDIDDDGLTEKIKYYVEGGSFTKSIIEPDPETYEYNEENEKIIKVIHDVIDKPIFYYYDSNYDGTASSTPLTYPVVPADVRMIKVIVEIDSDPLNPPEAFSVETQVSLRNLKDNL